MAVKATIYKAQVQVSDVDRGHYDTHVLTLAQHPSETEERLMVRLLAFALNADERLAFGRGISTDDEPDIWRRDMTGVIEQWIEIGQPDEQRIRKACGRSGEVLVYCFSGRSADIWWEKNAAGLGRCGNLRVFQVSTESSQALAALAARNMELQVIVQEGAVQVMDAAAAVDVEISVLK